MLLFLLNIIQNIKRKHLLKYYKNKFKSCGKNFNWNPLTSIFVSPENIEIGNNVFLGEGFHISASLKIGDGVIVGPRLVIMGGDHNFSVIGKRMYDVTTGGINLSVEIEKDVWIGASVVILKGVTINEGSIIGAGSVVVKSIPPYSIAIGNPARVIKKRFSDNELTSHLFTLGYKEDKISQIIKMRNDALIL